MWNHGPAERSNITCPLQQAVASSSTTQEVADHEAKEKGSKPTQEETENMKELKVSGDTKIMKEKEKKEAKDEKKYGITYTVNI